MTTNALTANQDAIPSSALEEVESCQSCIGDEPADCYPDQQYENYPAKHSPAAAYK